MYKFLGLLLILSFWGCDKRSVRKIESKKVKVEETSESKKPESPEGEEQPVSYYPPVIKTYPSIKEPSPTYPKKGNNNPGAKQGSAGSLPSEKKRIENQPEISRPVEVKVEDNKSKVKKKDAIYCMTKMETNGLMDIHDSPELDVLYLRVSEFIDYGVENKATIELSKLFKKNFSRVEPNIQKSTGSLVVYQLNDGEGLSLKFLPMRNDFIETELEFKIYKNQCLGSDCIKKHSSFFNAEGGAYIYLTNSENPTLFSDDRVSCYFSDEALEKLKVDLFSNP